MLTESRLEPPNLNFQGAEHFPNYGGPDFSDFYSQSVGCLDHQYNPTATALMSSIIGYSLYVFSPVELRLTSTEMYSSPLALYPLPAGSEEGEFREMLNLG
jgi:hypothetical protein